MAFGSSLSSLAGAGGGNYVGGALVRLLLDSAQFDAGLRTAESRLHRWGGKVSSVGGTMTRGLTVPILGAGAAAVKMAMDYETAFTRISATTNASEETIRGWKKEVLGLAEATGKSPRELAEGLYFLASAGLKANQIMPTLEMSAKASAAGLGEVGDIARLTANVLNAYADSGMTAKRSMDILFAAIKEGTADPDEFANAMGRILPIASKAGVGFDELAGSLAGLSNIGLDVNEGVTAMRGLLQALVAPGTQAADTLKDVGISADQMRKVISEDGILGALQLLDKRTGGNIDTLRKIIPNVRGLTAELALTGPKADDVAASFDRITKAKGDLDKGFKETTKDPAFQWQQIMAKLQTTAIQFGTDLLPIVGDIGDAIGDILQWIGDLDEETRGRAIKWALIVAGVGPVLKVLGTLMQVGGGAVHVIKKLKGVLGTGGMIVGAAAIAGAVNLALSLKEAREQAENLIEGLGDEGSMQRFGIKLDDLAERANSFGTTLKETFGALFGGEAPAAAQLMAIRTEAKKVLDTLEGYPAATAAIKSAQAEFAIMTGEVANHEADLAEAREKLAMALEINDWALEQQARKDVAEASDELAWATKMLENDERNLTNALKDQAVASLELQMLEQDRNEIRDSLSESADAVTSSELDIRDAMRNLADARKELLGLEEKGIKSGRRYKEAQDAVTRAELAVAGAQRRHRQSIKQLTDEVQAATNTGKVTKDSVIELAEAWGIGEKKIKDLIDDLPNASAKIEELGAKGKLTKDQVEILHKAIEALQGRMNNTPKSVTTRFNYPGLNEGLRSAKDYEIELRGLDGKIVTVTYKYFGQVTGTHPGGSGGHVVGKQTGGPMDPNRWYLAGERGPELLHIGSRGGFMYDDHATRRIRGQGGGGVSVYIGTLYAPGADRQALERAGDILGDRIALHTEGDRQMHGRHDATRGRS